MIFRSVADNVFSSMLNHGSLASALLKSGAYNIYRLELVSFSVFKNTTVLAVGQ